jgi:gamma-glutamylcyclotransferase (GGCT)/AIG2-like uncharacterized protein YtfP
VKLINLLFVYGTLDPKENWFGKNGIETNVIGKAQIKGIKLSGTQYPAAIPPREDKQETINGSLIELIHPETAFPIIDEYEEYYPNDISKSFYIRAITEASLKDRKNIKCWVYWCNK